MSGLVIERVSGWGEWSTECVAEASWSSSGNTVRRVSLKRHISAGECSGLSRRIDGNRVSSAGSVGHSPRNDGVLMHLLPCVHYFGESVSECNAGLIRVQAWRAVQLLGRVDLVIGGEGSASVAGDDDATHGGRGAGRASMRRRRRLGIAIVGGVALIGGLKPKVERTPSCFKLAPLDTVWLHGCHRQPALPHATGCKRPSLHGPVALLEGCSRPPLHDVPRTASLYAAPRQLKTAVKRRFELARRCI